MGKAAIKRRKRQRKKQQHCYNQNESVQVKEAIVNFHTRMNIISSIENIQNILKDKSVTCKYINLLADKWKINERIRCYALLNCNIIFAEAESPIELLFFNAINCINLVFGMYIMNFGTQGLTTVMQNNQTIREQNDQIIEKQKNELVFFTTKEKGLIFKKDFVFLGMSMHNFVLQAKLFDMRVDALCISDGLKRIVIIECDGYRWHKNQDVFVKDRKRARELQRNGFDIVQYAGCEIVKNPMQIANDLFEYLMTRWTLDNELHSLGEITKDRV